MAVVGEDVLSSQSKVVREILIADGFGVMSGIRAIDAHQTLLVDPPQIYVRSAPQDLSYIILLKDVPGMEFGEDMSTGHPFEHPGVHITVRHPNDDGYSLIKSIYEFLGYVRNVNVTIGSYTYNIQNINRTRRILDIGEDEEKGWGSWTCEVCVVFQDPPRTVVED